MGAKLARDSGRVANIVVSWLTSIASKLCSHRIYARLTDDENEKAPEMFNHFRGLVIHNNGGEIGI